MRKLQSPGLQRCDLVITARVRRRASLAAMLASLRVDVLAERGKQRCSGVGMKLLGDCNFRESAVDRGAGCRRPFFRPVIGEFRERAAVVSAGRGRQRTGRCCPA